ncbi:MAG: hypothetical protein LH467_00425 [Gemmatimonadaceae bacterium]|nr:hypothetical protein [Gemmatimonadaceae bacterium]
MKRTPTQMPEDPNMVTFALPQGLGGALLTGAVGQVIGLVRLWGGRDPWGCIVLHGLVDFIEATESCTAGPGV